ncbi:flavodoxin [Dictyocaulus viviparus]|uniref:Flavodoxin n=1 Tax=Dictyocaulus viviparus TaxID=29172 RepID=A0A0D8Y250_DICVI|nr:flavodoxin [Dictyocaulus viviparus]
MSKESEAYRVISEDSDPYNGFILSPDIKWDGKSVGNLYLSDMTHRKRVRAICVISEKITDLTAENLHLLENLRSQSLSAIPEKYSCMQSLLILYGSETGTAESVAESIWKEARLLNVPARLYGLDEYDVKDLHNECVVVFVIATTGQGEVPPNMRSAWRTLLRKDLQNDWLQRVQFAVLGLGDSSYQKFNFASKKVYRRLLQLGGKCLMDIGLVTIHFTIHLLFVFKTFDMRENFDPLSIMPAKYRLVFNEKGPPLCENSNSTQQFHEIHVYSNDRLTSVDHFQDTRLISFEYSTSTMGSYGPGDVLMVQPQNLHESVQIALEALKYSDGLLDRPLRLVPSDQFVKLPPYWLSGKEFSLRSCFLRFFDLQMVPRKSFFETLASVSTDSDERAKLLEFIRPEGLDDFLEYTVKSRRTAAEVLRDFPKTSMKIPPERLFELFTIIRPRAFSIASAPSPNFIEILVAKVEYRTRMADKRRGLCSSYISGLVPGDKVFARIRSGTFKFPKEDIPVICIGPGTGVAPFRSYLTWRNRCKATTDSLLFFGCRGKKLDFYFENEWSKLSTTQLIPAFSRDTIGKKEYVQHMVMKHADKVWNIVGEQGGFVFIAGSSGNMPKEVGAALDRIATEHGWIKDTFISRMEAIGRVQYETWS